MTAIAGVFGRPPDPRMEAALAHRGPVGWADTRLDDGADLRAAYERWGEACPERLRGDFAFAIRDERRDLLFCARDRFGVKPFYYCSRPGFFAFASEIKGLLALPEVPRRLNEARVADHLAGRFDDRTSTFYRAIHRLEPGHCLTVTRDGVAKRRYWTLEPREERLSDEGYAERFRELFLEAVRVRLGGTPGAFLSGGLDSSSVACAASRLTGRPLHTFTALFDGPGDERRFVDAVLSRGGFVPHFVDGRVSPLADYDSVIRAQDEPFFEFNLTMDWELYRAAKSAGVTAVLEGFDGDTTVSHGLAWLTELSRSGRWATLWTELRGVCRHLGLSPWRVFKHRVLRPFVRTKNVFLTEREQHRHFLEWGGNAWCLEVSDRAAAAFGVEPRFPFFDVALVEFCLGLPPRQKLRDGWTRRIQRRAMEGVLPREVQWRESKADLGPCFFDSLLAHERGRIEEVLRDPGPAAAYVDPKMLRAAYDRYSTGSRRDAVEVWKAVTLALWLRSTGVQP